ncbi:MAG: hypothetical protein KJ063_25755, partial [Anaerolineae bacterium]|nr:hypothetical protein [Anaerolineae bacterium]
MLNLSQQRWNDIFNFISMKVAPMGFQDKTPAMVFFTIGNFMLTPLLVGETMGVPYGHMMEAKNRHIKQWLKPHAGCVILLVIHRRWEMMYQPSFWPFLSMAVNIPLLPGRGKTPTSISPFIIHLA